jgi:hypothetical protein
MTRTRLRLRPGRSVKTKASPCSTILPSDQTSIFMLGDPPPGRGCALAPPPSVGAKTYSRRVDAKQSPPSPAYRCGQVASPNEKTNSRWSGPGKRGELERTIL